MRRHGPPLAALLTLAAFCASAADLGECVGIKDDAVRLFCYDRVAGRTPPATADSPAPPAVAAPTAAAPAAAAPEPVEPKHIESRIVGSFDGWRQGTRFKLENGQTWESIGTSTFNVRKIEGPQVVLERDFLGQLKMKIDGVGTRVAVRRIDE